MDGRFFTHLTETILQMVMCFVSNFTYGAPSYSIIFILFFLHSACAQERWKDVSKCRGCWESDIWEFGGKCMSLWPFHSAASVL